MIAPFFCMHQFSCTITISLVYQISEKNYKLSLEEISQEEKEEEQESHMTEEMKKEKKKKFFLFKEYCE